MKKILFVTQNNYKFQKFQEALGTDSQFEQLSIETPEIQAKDNKSVAEYSAEWAANFYNSPVICEDIGLYISALNGFPGPYLSQVEKWLKTQGFLKQMDGEQNRTANWEFAVAYCEPGKKPVSFQTFPSGKISLEAKGNDGWYADKIFIPEGETLTIAELLDEKRYQRSAAHYHELLKYLKKETVYSAK